MKKLEPKKIFRFILKNYLIFAFFGIIFLVGLFAFKKYFFTQSHYVYIKVKVGQGLWWMTTQKPSLWLINNIKKGEIETDLFGRPSAEILSTTYYPTYLIDQYDTYVDLKLRVEGNINAGKIIFDRSPVEIGSPIDLEFPSVQFSGTVVDISLKPVKDVLIEKIVYLSKSIAYPWEYEAIKVGDKYFDGETNVMEIIDKSSGESTSAIDLYKSAYNLVIDQSTTQPRVGIIVKLKVFGKMLGKKFVFGNDQVLNIGKTVSLTTDRFNFVDYIVSRID